MDVSDTADLSIVKTEPSAVESDEDSNDMMFLLTLDEDDLKDVGDDDNDNEEEEDDDYDIATYTSDNNEETGRSRSVRMKNVQGKVRKRRIIRPKRTNPSRQRGAFLCPQCDKTYTFKNVLVQHIKQVHTNLRPFLCKCGKNFKTRKALREHEKLHLNLRPFKCECGLYFKTKSNLRTHKMSHSDIRHYQCEECGKNFKTSYKLRMHKLVHSDFRSYECECSRAYKTKGALLKHITRSHLGLKEFHCVCGLSFKSKEQVRQHMPSHFGEISKRSRDVNKPITCKLCLVVFHGRKEYDVHRKTVHADVLAERKKCLSQFRNDPMLTNPSLKHSLFECGMCNKQFKGMKRLQTHSKMKHLTDLDPSNCVWHCVTCGEGFDSQPLLFEHLKIHNVEETEDFCKDTSITDLKAHCRLCNSAFVSVEDLATHIESHSNECMTCKLTPEGKLLIAKHCSHE